MAFKSVRMLWCYLFCFCVLYDVYKFYVAPIIALWAYNKFEPWTLIVYEMRYINILALPLTNENLL